MVAERIKRRQNVDRPYSKLEKVEKPKVFLATPLRKNMNIHAETSAFCSYTSGFPDVQWGWTGTLSPEMSRNNLIEDHEFHRQEYTHVFYVDSDTVPPNNALPVLLEADADVIVGITPIIANEGFCWSVAVDEDDDWIPMSEDLPRDPFEVKCSGASCLLARREVIRDIGWPWFKTEYQPKWENKGQAIKCGEDMYFFKKAREKGYKIMADPFVICEHYNKVGFLNALRLAKKLFKK
jgi:hypothetical protein